VLSVHMRTKLLHKTGETLQKLTSRALGSIEDNPTLRKLPT